MSRLRALLALTPLLVAAACTIDPTVLTPEAEEERDHLELRLAEDPADLDALEELAELQCTFLQFRDIEERLLGTVRGVALAPGDLERLASVLERTGQSAERARRQHPERADGDMVYRLAGVADGLRARAAHLERRDRSAVRAHAWLPDGSRRELGDVMLRCTNSELAGSGAIGRHLTFPYFTERLAVTTPSGPRGSRDLEYPLASIDRIRPEIGPEGERRLTVVPAAWNRRLPTCTACEPHAPCVVVGDRSGGGLGELEIGGLRELHFTLEALPPLGALP